MVNQWKLVWVASYYSDEGLTSKTSVLILPTYGVLHYHFYNPWILGETIGTATKEKAQSILIVVARNLGYLSSASIFGILHNQDKNQARNHNKNNIFPCSEDSSYSPMCHETTVHQSLDQSRFSRTSNSPFQRQILLQLDQCQSLGLDW